MHNRCLYWFVPIGCQPQINIFPPWKGIIRRKKSPGWRLYSLFFQGLSALLVSRSLFSIPEFTDFLPRILGMTLERSSCLESRYFIGTLTQWTFPYPSALIALLTSDELSSLSLSPMAGNTELLYQDEWASPAKAWRYLSAWGPEWSPRTGIHFLLIYVVFRFEGS